MADTVPPDRRLDRAALERIILRAAQLQAGERDLDEVLTEDDALRLGSEVGIPAVYLRQALVEERTRALAPPERGLAAMLAGPRFVVAARAVPGAKDAVERALGHWMTTGELLTVKRRFPDATSWETQRGTLASIKRSFRVGGRDYALARASEVVGQVTALGADRTHVRLLADLANTRQSYLGGASALAAVGAGVAGVGLVLGFAVPFALLPIPLGVLAGWAVARSRDVERFRVALEQVLDRLEHGEIRPQQATRPKDPLSWLALEIRRQLED